MALLFIAGAAALAGPVLAQTAAVAQPNTGGLQNSWDVRKTITNVTRDAEQMQPLLKDLDPQGWYDKKGAPTTYIVQWQAAQQQLKDVIIVAKSFAQRTESLSQGLDIYFRLEALETTERALAEGAQHYDSRATADRLNALIANNFTSREGLREYLRELATSTEQNFKIADQEAQRCRSSLIQRDASTSGSKGRK